MYLAEHRESHEKYAIKAIQKKKLKDYTTFINEINILKVLVSFLREREREMCGCLTNTLVLLRLLKSFNFFVSSVFWAQYRITQISSSCTRSGSGTTFASSFWSKYT